MAVSKAHRLNQAFWIYMVMTLFREVVENCFNNQVFASLFSYLLFFYAIAVLFIFTSLKQKRRLFVILSIFTVFFGANFVVFPDDREYIIESAINIVTGTLPLMLILSSVTDYGDFIKNMEKWAYPYIGLGGLYVVLKYIGIVSEEIDYMQVAYYVLIPVCILGYLGIHHNNIIYKTIFFIFILAILLLGSRGGALVGIIVYGGLYLSYMKKKKRRLVLIIGSLFIALVLVNYNFVMSGFESVLSQNGYEGRITHKLESGELFQSEGRVLRQTVIIGAIVSNNYMPFGIFGDRELTRSVTEFGDASYAHNIILEFIVDFGLVGGIIAFVLLIWWIVRSYRRADDFAKGVILLFALYSLTKLMLSMSYLIEDTFYCLIGVLISCSMVFKKQPKYAIKKNSNHNL